TGCSNGSAADGSCSFAFPTGGKGGQVTLTYHLTIASTSDIGQGKKGVFGNSSVKVTDDASRPDTPSFTVTLDGPPAPTPPPATNVTGDVFDITTGQAVSNALVNLQDAGNHSYTTHTDSKGHYQFTNQPSTPIAAGTIFIGATKNGFQARV